MVQKLVPQARVPERMSDRAPEYICHLAIDEYYVYIYIPLHIVYTYTYYLYVIYIIIFINIYIYIHIHIINTFPGGTTGPPGHLPESHVRIFDPEPQSTSWIPEKYTNDIGIQGMNLDIAYLYCGKIIGHYICPSLLYFYHWYMSIIGIKWQYHESRWNDMPCTNHRSSGGRILVLAPLIRILESCCSEWEAQGFPWHPQAIPKIASSNMEMRNPQIADFPMNSSISRGYPLVI